VVLGATFFLTLTTTSLAIPVKLISAISKHRTSASTSRIVSPDLQKM